ncbi:MAG: hypothetical protein LBF22_01750 [Deltaproteobacteria bacterium]|jgi:hypothetical protein|nr:hypothetical protein [Deltaproteobacteria bacterium]
MNVTNSTNNLTGLLVTSLFKSQKEQTDLALKQIEVITKGQLAIQQQQTALMAVALLSGIGTKINIVV